MTAEAASARATFKPREVDELIDVHLHRATARGVVALLKNTRVTSNQVTVASGLVGILSGLFVGLADPANAWLAAVGGLVLFVSVVLDCTDGQLARLRGTSSLVGRALDGAIDMPPVISIFFGQLALLLAAGFEPWMMWGLGIVAGASNWWHTIAYDHAKNLFLTNTMENPSKEAMPTFEEIEAERQRLLDAGQPVMAWVMTLFRNYTNLQRTRRRAHMGLDTPPPRTPEGRRAYYEAFAWHMRLWSWNGVGWHNFLLYGGAIFAIVDPIAIVIVWAWIATVQNVMALVCVVATPRLDARVRRALAAIPGETTATPMSPPA